MNSTDIRGNSMINDKMKEDIKSIIEKLENIGNDLGHLVEKYPLISQDTWYEIFINIRDKKVFEAVNDLEKIIER